MRDTGCPSAAPAASVCTHASLGFRPPAPQVFVPALAAWPPALRRPAVPATHASAPRPTLN
jgi:hypothetical protein